MVEWRDDMAKYTYEHSGTVWGKGTEETIIKAE